MDSERISATAINGLLLLGVALRVLLFWVNPPVNAFDDHLEPVAWMIKTGAIPAKDACFQCYHPPVYYALAAAVGKLALAAGGSGQLVAKLAQAISCAAGVLTLLVVRSILFRLTLSSFARLLAFGTVCFLPRHVYASAMLSNDTVSHLGVASCVLAAIVMLDRRCAPRWAALLGALVAVTIFTKYTAFIVLPALAAALGIAWLRRFEDRRRVAVAASLSLLPALVLLGAFLAFNQVTYGSVLPWNVSMLDPSETQPRDEEGVSFVTFKPWETVRQPILAPGNLDSFWTLVHGRMWFDMEPKFLYFVDPGDWWSTYYGWLRGENDFPESAPPLSGTTVFLARALMLLGLVPLGLVLLGGAWLALRRLPAGPGPVGREPLFAWLFGVLIAFNVAGIVALTVRLPVFCAMKALYFLPSLPALAAMLGAGVSVVENRRGVRPLLAVGFGALFVLVTVHILVIVRSVP